VVPTTSAVGWSGFKMFEGEDENAYDTKLLKDSEVNPVKVHFKDALHFD
jgi:hypothetical protein